MRYLLIPLLLVVTSSWPVWGWADTYDLRLEYTVPLMVCNKYAQCDPTSYVKHRWACYERMREALNIIDLAKHQALDTRSSQFYDTLTLVVPRKSMATWGSTMHDCVDGER